MATLRHLPVGRLLPGPATLAEPGTVLLETQRPDRENRRSYVLRHPVEVLECHCPEDVAGCLHRAERLLESGLALAGFVAYGAAAGLDPALPGRALGGFPLVWLAAYGEIGRCQGPLPLPPGVASRPVRNLEADLSRDAYIRAVERTQGYIGRGDNYQTNLTCRLRFDSDEEPLAAYLRLRQAHPVPYGAYLHCGGFQVVSQSPELFLRRRGQLLWTRPMKGTQRRAPGPAQDEAFARALARDPKARAENVMIVDLMRHDLGRLAEIGSVETFDLFRVERYRTLLQLTSGVRCRLRPGTTLTDILRATFPPGSVTGAPKRRTMQIIEELEATPRGLYTGCLGLFLPGGDFTLSVAIRTLVASQGRWELGIGSGIVADSVPEAEDKETRLKSRFFFEPPRRFQLLETLRWGPAEGFRDLAAHLRRLQRSARYFGYPWSRRRALAALAAPPDQAGQQPASAERRVRLLLGEAGGFEAQWQPLTPLPQPVGVLLSERRTDASQPWLYHKTTERALYEQELARARALGLAEAIFTNREGLLTEGAFTNLMVRLGGRWLTPPLSCGLLPGIWRAEFMRRRGAREALLRPADLAGAEEVVLGNSVRGEIAVGRIVDGAGRQIFGQGG